MPSCYLLRLHTIGWQPIVCHTRLVLHTIGCIAITFLTMKERWSKAELLALVAILLMLLFWLLGVFLLPYASHYSPVVR